MPRCRGPIPGKHEYAGARRPRPLLQPTTTRTEMLQSPSLKARPPLQPIQQPQQQQSPEAPIKRGLF